MNGHFARVVEDTRAERSRLGGTAEGLRRSRSGGCVSSRLARSLRTERCPTARVVRGRQMKSMLSCSSGGPRAGWSGSPRGARAPSCGRARPPRRFAKPGGVNSAARRIAGRRARRAEAVGVQSVFSRCPKAQSCHHHSVASRAQPPPAIDHGAPWQVVVVVRGRVVRDACEPAFRAALVEPGRVFAAVVHSPTQVDRWIVHARARRRRGADRRSTRRARGCRPRVPRCARRRLRTAAARARHPARSPRRPRRLRCPGSHRCLHAAALRELTPSAHGEWNSRRLPALVAHAGEPVDRWPRRAPARRCRKCPRCVERRGARCASRSRGAASPSRRDRARPSV